MLKQLLKTIRKPIALGVLGFGMLTLSSNAQTYLTENFDGTWSGSPATPSGWTQTRTIAVNTTSERDWAKNTYTAGAWSGAGGSGASDVAPGAVSGSGVLWLDDYNFSGSGTARSERRIESPTVDLSASTSPYVRFWYYCTEGVGLTMNVRVVVSNDGGTTWNTLSNVVNGFTTTANTWNKINIKIPASYKVSNAKFGVAIVNRWGNNGSPFIDDFTVEEFTPTTITSNATGNWNTAATWVGGVVPTADNNVVIATGHTVTMASTTSIIGRCQDLTIQSGATLTYAASTTANLIQVFGNVSIDGTLNSYNGTSGRILYVGGNFSINSGGTATLNVGTTTNATTSIPTGIATGASGIVFMNADAASFTNNGTLTGSRINNVWHLGSGTFTYNSAATVPLTFALMRGQVNPNSNLTLGNAAAASTTQTIIRVNGSFTAAPTFDNTNMTARNMAYYSVNMVGMTQQTISSGEEIHNNSGRIVTGSLIMNTHNNLSLAYPLTVGTTTTGALTLTKGIIVTDATNLLTLSSFISGPSGTTPSTTNPNPTTNGSYIAGPLRINFPSSGTTARVFALGVGTGFNGTTPNSNVLKTVTIATGTAWAGQTITLSNEAAATGTVSSPVNALLGTRTYRVNLNGGTDLPSTATLQLPAMNYTFGNSDNLAGLQSELYVVQSTSLTGAWTARTASTGTGSFTNNTQVTRTTGTAGLAIAPIATNGEYFTFGTAALPMTYQSGTVTRTTTNTGQGLVNQVILQVKVTTANPINPLSLTQFDFNTTGTSSTADITNAKVYSTGSSSTFANTTQFGSTLASPSGAFSITGTSTLAAGDNYYWLVYDIAASATPTNVVAAECSSVIVGGVTQTLTAPAAGSRTIDFPMTFVSARSTQTDTTKVQIGTTNNAIIGVQVVTSSTGSAKSVTSFDVSTNGTTTLADITNLKIWYTGSSKTFATTTQFGTTVAIPAATQTVTGTQFLVNDTNYFWVSYDIASGATLANAVDAECTGVTFDGTPQIPTVTAPTGNRKIKAAYCLPTYASGCGTDYIGRVVLKTLDNTSTCGGAFTFYSALAAPTLTQGETDTISITYGSDGNQYGRAWIDYNDDGDFNDAGEDLGIQSPANAGASGTSKIVFTVSCTSSTGLLRLRIRGGDDNQPSAAQSCGASGSGFGEGEDYLINVTANPIAYIGSTAIQTSSTLVAPGATDVSVLRMPVKVLGCGTIDVTQFDLNTGGSTSASDITNAKVYYTGSSSTFATTTLFGSLASPSGAFSITGTQTLVNDTNNFWLVYDVSGSATLGHVMDADFSSVTVGGVSHTPTVTSPSGTILIDAPMTFVSTTANVAPTTKVLTSSSNNNVVALEVVTSTIGSPINFTSLDIATTGTTSLTDITNLKVWYTGNSNVFDTTTQFGSTVAVPASTQTVTGTQPLTNNTNYFWVTYNIASGAVVGDTVDAEVTSITVDAVAHTPTVTAPTGNRRIKGAYCTSVYTTGTGSSDIITNVTFAGINNSTGASSAPFLTSYNLTASTTAGMSYPFSITVDPAGGNEYIGMWIDFDDDGTYSTSERLINNPQTVSNAYSTNITIPCSVTAGTYKMRVRISYGSTTGNFDPCSSYTYGETEEYYVTVVDNPMAYTTSLAVSSPLTLVSPGATDAEVLRLPVITTGCTPISATQFDLNTGSSTSALDITNATIYYTGSSSTFATTTLFGSLTSPSGAFSITGSQVLNSDTNNFWLVYDVSGSATTSHVLDADFSSVTVGGVSHTPTVTSPSGTILIDFPMTFTSTTSISVPVSKVEKPSTNNLVVGLQVVTSSTGAPINITSLDVATTGTTLLTDITNLKVWYTGNTKTFATTTQFGSTVASPAATQSITGVLPLTNDTNYFWVTYDVASGAVLGDTIDAEITLITVDAVTHTPTVTAPTGNRIIRAPYCTVSASGSACMSNVTFNTLNNASAACGGTYYTNFAPTGTNTTTVSRNTSYNLSVTTTDAAIISVWIDYNDDGTLAASEWQQVTTASTIGVPSTVSITIPCSAVLGELRMRVRSRLSGNQNGSGDACLATGSGEFEDYTITVVDNPIAYNTSLSMQSSISIASPGANDINVLRLPVRVLGCGTIDATQFDLNTGGSTSASDIANAKIYYTGSSSTFATTTLFGSVVSPSGAFSITGTQALVNDTNNFWLVYDVSGSATTGDVIDADFSSVTVGGNIYIPTITSPSGTILIQNPMTYVSSTATAGASGKVETSSVNNLVVGMQVVTSSTGAPINITSLDVATTGTTILTDITNLKVWYTGSSNVFATTTQFGSTIATPAATQSVAGVQQLVNDTNYFWVTYDIASGAVIGDTVDAAITSLTVAGNAYIPSVTAPAGLREIRTAYCVSAYTTGTGLSDIITNVTFGGINNSTGASSSPFLTSYNLTASTTAGMSYPFSITVDPAGGNEYVGMWIDFNDDGTYSASERLINDPQTTGYTYSTNVTIPCSVSAGTYKMRVRISFGSTTGNFDPCSSYTYGETEEYYVTVVDNPIVYNSSFAEQQVATVAPGTTGVKVLRMPVTISGCGSWDVSQFDLNTNGTSVAANITNAYVYYTGSSNVFSTTTLFGSVASPSGAFSISGTQTLLSDTNNFWLAYDVAALAAYGNTLDAEFNGVTVNAVSHVPTVTAPSGDVLIDAPMTYVSSTTTQNVFSKVEQSSVNNQIIGIQVVTSSIGSSIDLTQLDLSTNGTTNDADITNVSVWYTGNTNAFATTTLFGSLANPSGSYSVTGTQALAFDTNYFWVTYDIASGATLTDVVDAEFISVTVAGVPHTPLVSAPTGTREIRAPYCTVSASGSACMSNVTFNTLNNSSATCATPYYTNFAPTGTNTTTLSRNTSYNLSVTTTDAAIISVWIDYNNDGTLAASEWQQVATASTIGVPSTISITIPCTAELGDLRMRVRSRLTGNQNGSGDACLATGSGEFEDYTITIVDNPIVYNTGLAYQTSTVLAAPGATNVSVIRMPLVATGCGSISATQFDLATTGTTSVLDITTAKIYYTGSSNVFSTSTLFGSLSSPSGAFSITGTQTLATDTNNFWLVYDVSASATIGNILDAEFTSVTVDGITHTPTVTSPSGNILIDVPMSYVSSTVLQPITTKVDQGVANTQIIAVQVVGSSTGAPVSLTSLDIATTGTTSLSDIANLNVWYTGASKTFATTTQFGTTVATPAATQSVVGSQILANDTNYFWITYDISATAVIGNAVDAECTSITFAGTPQIPTITAPAGDRKVRSPYCLPTYASGCGTDFINRVILKTLDNNGTGCTGASTFYSNLASPTLYLGESDTISITYGSDPNQYARAWIDYNDDGDFNDAGEDLGAQSPANAGASGTSKIGFTVPVNAATGQFRLRIRGGDDSQPSAAQSCGASGSAWGESEDYIITIDSAPAPIIYVWNQTGSADYTIASNWTPTRTTPFFNDILEFNGGGAITVTKVANQVVSKVIVDNSTEVTFDAGTAVNLVISNELALTSGRIITGSNVNPTLGINGTSTGTLSGTGNIEGTFTRWIAASTGSYTFPLSVTNPALISSSLTRSASVNYTTAPTAAGKLTVKYVTGAPGTAGLPVVNAGITFSKISVDGIWRASAASGLTGGTFDVTIAADAINGVTDYTLTGLLSRANNASSWLAAGTHVTTTGSNSSMVLSRTGLTAYGEMGIAGDAVNPLPVDLISFTGVADAKNAYLTWVTANETNNKGFEVERSIDGKNFAQITFVKGAGTTSNTQNYATIDADVFDKTQSKTIYYRLKQVDFNGNYRYSNIVSVYNTKAGATSVTASPNPFNTNFNLSVVANEAGVAEVEMVDVQGKLIATRTITCTKGINSFTIDELSNVYNGVYFVKFTLNGQTMINRLVKVN